MNYYALEPIILARLTAHCPSIGDIQGLPDAYALTELAQNAKPSTHPHHPVANPTGTKHGGAYLIFFDEMITAARADGCVTANQTWLIAVVASKHQKMRTGVEARQECGALTDQVITALRGWNYGADLPQGQGGRRFLERVTAPLNRHQFLPDQNGLVTTWLAYTAKGLVY